MEELLGSHVQYLPKGLHMSAELQVALGITRDVSWQLLLGLLVAWSRQQQGGRFTCSTSTMAGALPAGGAMACGR
jgi:hypothetical protein